MGQQDSSSAETARDEIGASDRFEIRECLGSGAFGTVYEAFDRERGGRVALKRLHRSDPTAIYRFKKEFRALALNTSLVPEAEVRAVLVRDTDAMIIRLGGTPPTNAGVKANGGTSLAGVGRLDDDAVRIGKNGRLR